MHVLCRFVLLVAVAAVFALPAHAEIKIVALGDSNFRPPDLSADLFGGVALNDAYPARLERALKARGHDAHVVNAGVPGDTTKGVMNRIHTAVPEGTQIVVLSIGINDILEFGIDRPTVFRNLYGIIEALRDRHIEVLAFLPVTYADGQKGELADYPPAVQAPYRHLEQRGVVFTPSFQWKLLKDPRFHVEEIKAGDGTLQRTEWHLNIAGIDLVVARTVPLVETLIGRLGK